MNTLPIGDGLSDPNSSPDVGKDDKKAAGHQAAKQAWRKPAVAPYGGVRRITKGISYNPNDGLSNLTP